MDRVGEDLLHRVGVLIGKRDGDVVLVVLLVYPVHSGRATCAPGRRQLLRNQEKEELPKGCLRLGDRRHVHVDSEFGRCAGEETNGSAMKTLVDYLKRFPKS